MKSGEPWGHLQSILVIVDRLDLGRAVVAKAVVLARHFGARVELFLCDSEQIFSIRHSYDVRGAQRALQSCIAEGGRYLEALRHSIAPDVRVTTYVAASSPLYEAIVERVRESSPDLVIKGRHSDLNDGHLVRTCPVPLMLTRGRPWAAHPRFAAAVDVNDAGRVELSRQIVRLGIYLGSGSQATFDIVHSEPDPAAGSDASARRTALEKLRADFDVEPGRLHVLKGEPEQTLPAFLGRQNYDVLLLGALSGHGVPPELPVGTLTGCLIEAVKCDVVLLKPPAPADLPTRTDAEWSRVRLR